MKNNKLWIRKQTSVKFHNWRFERTAVILVVTFTSSKEEEEEAGSSRLLLCILLHWKCMKIDSNYMLTQALEGFLIILKESNVNLASLIQNA